MRLFNFVRRYPVLMLGIIAIAFIGWIWSDVGFRVRDVEVIDPRIVERPRPVTDLELMHDAVHPAPREKTKPNPQDTAHVLPKLKPGMTRAEVEGLVGTPAAGDTHPAEVADGRVIYRTTYEVDLDPPQTVRPIRPFRPMPPTAKPPSDRTLITLEFDATKPGHPLLGILYPDPLF